MISSNQSTMSELSEASRKMKMLKSRMRLKDQSHHALRGAVAPSSLLSVRHGARGLYPPGFWRRLVARCYCPNCQTATTELRCANY